jgi:DNA gyrase subunit B
MSEVVKGNQFNDYNDESIRALKGAQRVRERVAVMLGSNDINGAFHTFKEIIGNSMDETRAGFGKRLGVVYHEDGSISVRDYGRGVPMGWNEKEGRFNWDLVFNELYAGGKYDEENPTYQYSIGLNGLGAASTQYTSDYFKVTSYRDGKALTKEFRNGEPTDPEAPAVESAQGDEANGTFVHWKPTLEVFSNVDFGVQMFTVLLEAQAVLNQIQITFDDRCKTKAEHVFEPVSFTEYLRSRVGADQVVDILTTSIEHEGEDKGKKYVAKVDLLVAITTETQSRRLFYHNTSIMNGGVHFQAFDDAVTQFFKQIGKTKGLEIKPVDYADYLSVMCMTYSSAVLASLQGQTKDRSDSSVLYNLMFEAVKNLLEVSEIKKVATFMEMLENVLIAAQARKDAKELEVKQRLALKATGKRRDKAEKYVDCQEKDPKKRELFIVEGDSAKGSCKLARDGKFQALLPVKGKPMNGLKATLEDLLENQEVKDIISTLGCGVDIEGVDMFDEANVQFDKIIITTDADIDGQQIRVLLYTLFYRLMPRLLEKGYIYVAETPLFELEMSNGTSWFAYNSDERDQLIEEARKQRLTIKKTNRSKGLGENNPDMLWETTMNPETRRLVPLTIDIKDQVVRDVSNMLFGLDPSNERKGFIFSLLEAKLGEDIGLSDLVETLTAIDANDVEEIEAAV